MFTVNMTTDNHGYMLYIGIYWYMVLYLLNHVIPTYDFQELGFTDVHPHYVQISGIYR